MALGDSLSHDGPVAATKYSNEPYLDLGIAPGDGMTKRIRAVDRKATAVEYVGDGVYAAYDGYGFWITAEDGIKATDVVYLEPYAWKLLARFVQTVAGL